MYCCSLWLSILEVCARHAGAVRCSPHLFRIAHAVVVYYCCMLCDTSLMWWHSTQYRVYLAPLPGVLANNSFQFDEVGPNTPAETVLSYSRTSSSSTRTTVGFMLLARMDMDIAVWYPLTDIWCSYMKTTPAVNMIVLLLFRERGGGGGWGRANPSPTSVHIVCIMILCCDIDSAATALLLPLLKTKRFWVFFSPHTKHPCGAAATIPREQIIWRNTTRRVSALYEMVKHAPALWNIMTASVGAACTYDMVSSFGAVWYDTKCPRCWYHRLYSYYIPAA